MDIDRAAAALAEGARFANGRAGWVVLNLPRLRDPEWFPLDRPPPFHTDRLIVEMPFVEIDDETLYEHCRSMLRSALVVHDEALEARSP